MTEFAPKNPAAECYGAKVPEFSTAEPPKEELQSLLKTFAAYVAKFDGTPRDFVTVSYLFEKIYHDDFTYKADGTPVDKAQIKQFQSDFLRLGSRATLLHLQAIGSDRVEFKYRMTNERIDVLIHNIAYVRDNKFVLSETIDQASMNSVTKLREVCQTYESEDVSLKVANTPFAQNSDISIAPQ